MRRDFLKLCSLVGLGVATPMNRALLAATPSSQEPDPYPGPYYVVFNASGGWDTSYLMDPKGVHGINNLYQEGDILTHGRHRFAPTSKHLKGGMSNEEFFKIYGEDLLVFQGLDYSVNNHSPCSRYMATGKLDSLVYPTFAALVAACKGPDCPLSFLTFGNYSATGNLVPMARVPYLHSLKLLANADGVHGNAASPYHDDFAIDRIDAALRRHADARQAKAQLPRTERAQSMLFAAQLNSKALRRVSPYLSDEVPKEPLFQQAEIALAAFKAGVAVSANLNLSGFDSHANNDRDQLKLLPELLAGIDHLMKHAEKLGIREKIVVVMQSEMGRTPGYNKNEGKDHWSIGSAMFMGNGIRGNRVIGATDEQQDLIPIDPGTLALKPEGGIRVKPEHLHTALREHAGIADHALSEKFPLRVEEPELLKGLWG
ncbi:DUF1501 domain-containing protein [Verrucomicrobiaceae bacterium 227]